MNTLRNTMPSIWSAFFESPFRVVPFWLLAILGFLLSAHNPYFWDTIQFGSEHAHWYYNHNFSKLLLPQEYDSGHPPLFGMYVALWWKLFGKALPISHLSMLPFTLLSIYLLFKIGDKILGQAYSVFFVLLCALDPVNAAQHILVSPDIIIYCGTLICFYGLLYQKKIMLLLGVLLLSCISMRGLSVAAAFGFYETGNWLWNHRPVKLVYWKNILKISLPYLPGLFLFVSFMIYHYQQCGWIGYHENSPWAESFEKVGANGFVRNIIVAGVRMIEFGRIGIIAVLLVLLWKRRKDLTPYSNSLILLFCLTLCLIVPQLFYKELLGPRYFMPVFMIISLLLCQLLFHNPPSSKQFKIILFISLILVTGNFWRYPRQIAMGWDATLSHVFYFKPRAQMLAYIEDQKIPYESIGSHSLEGGPRENIDLNGNPHSFQPLDVATQRYVYYTSVMNLPDNILDQLFSEFEIKQQYENRGIEVILFEKKTVQK